MELWQERIRLEERVSEAPGRGGYSWEKVTSDLRAMERRGQKVGEKWGKESLGGGVAKILRLGDLWRSELLWQLEQRNQGESF